VVIANLTKVAGNWQALFNDELWKNNSLIGSVYHASLRAIVEDLGYQTRQTGKHGQFEIEAFPGTFSRLSASGARTSLPRPQTLGAMAEIPNSCARSPSAPAMTRSIWTTAMVFARSGGAGCGVGV
jgi:conjugative relaxase-like TrwC/TraI family protein